MFAVESPLKRLRSLEAIQTLPKRARFLKIPDQVAALPARRIDAELLRARPCRPGESSKRLIARSRQHRCTVRQSSPRAYLDELQKCR